MLIENIYGIGTNWHFEFFEQINRPFTNLLFTDEVSNLPEHINFDNHKTFNNESKLKLQIQIIINKFEQNYSRFITESKLCQLNKNKVFENPSKEFQKLVKIGINAYKNTNRVFNFCIIDALENIGYDKNYSLKKSNESEVIKILNPINNIIVNQEKIELLNNISIEFGGLGKGFLIKKLADYFIKKLQLKYFVINGGGDIYATSNFGKPIDLYLQHPIYLDKFIKKLQLKNMSLCASSTYKRRWQYKNKTYCHIIDTQNIEKVNDIATFVWVKNPIYADILSTTLCINNRKEFIQLLKKSYKFDYLIYKEK